jgi:hypothetical protein
MPSFTKSHAEDTVKKLRRKTAKGKTVFTVNETSGHNHRLFQVFHAGTWICAFGINHGSRKNAGHAWVYEQMRLNRSEGLRFAACPLTIEELLKLFRARGVVEPEDT